jgi:hypothetical protein
MGQAYTEGVKTWYNFPSWVTTTADKMNKSFNQTPGLVSTDFGRAYTQSTGKWTGFDSWVSGRASAMSKGFNGMPSEVEGHFRTAFSNSTTTATTFLEKFMTYFKGLNFKKDASINADQESFRQTKSWYQEIASQFKDIKATFALSSTGISSVMSQIGALISKLNSAKSLSSSIGVGLSSGFSTATKARYFASGGIVNSATPAIIGERGSEAVIPLTDGTLGKLSTMIVGEMARPNVTPIANSTYSMGGVNAESVAEQNRLLREQNELLRRIADKDFSVSGREVFNAVKQESDNYYNRTGNSAFVF